MASSAVVGILRVLLTANAAELDSTLKASSGKIGSFQKLVDSFNGKNLETTSIKMADAIEKIGGATKLTSAELSRVRGVVDATAEKFRALGQELPPQVAKLRNEIAALDAASGKAASGGVSQLASAGAKLNTLLAAAGIAGGIAGVVAGLSRMASSAFEAAGHITDLSQKTGLSTDAIQEMQAVANQTGTSVDAFAQATFKLGVNVADGSKKARDAVKDLGLAYDQLKNQRPEDQFRSVVKALEGVDNAQERNRLGVALFGKQFSEIAASIAAGYSGMADAAAKSSADQIRALDDAGDAWQRFLDGIKATSVSVFGSIALAFEDTFASLNLGDLSKFTEAEQSRIKDALGRGGEGLAKVLRDISAARKTDIELTQQGNVANADYVAQLAAVRAEVAALTPVQRTQIDAALKLSSITEELADHLGVSQEALKLYQDQAREAGQRTKELANEKEKAAKAAEKFAQSVRNLTSVLVPFAASVKDAETALHDVGGSLHNLASGTLQETAKETEAARKATDEWADANGARLAPSIQAVGSASEDAALDVITFGQSIKGALADLPKVIQGALQGGGDLGKSIGSLFGSSIFSEDSGLVKSLTGGLTKILRKTIGGAIGSILPGLGTLLGAGIGALTDKLFGKLFGGEGKKVNDLRDAFTSAAGGIDKLAERAAAAGLTLERFYKAKTVQEYEAAINELNAAFERLDARRAAAASLFDQIMEAGSTGIPAAMKPAIDALIALGLLTDEQVTKLKKLGDGSEINVDQLKADLDLIGGRLEDLGPKFQQANIDKTAAKYVNSIDRMIQAGGDVGGILFDSKEEISDLVNQALKFGTTLPENMKPWIEELARAGLLLDANGNKITDISNIKFGDKIETEQEKTNTMWQTILKSIQDLIDTIKGPLTGAINGIPDSKRIKVTVDYEDSGRPGGDAGDRGHAVGTMGRYGEWFANFGRGTRTTLHGMEAVLTKAQAVPFAMHVLDSLPARLPQPQAFNPALSLAGLEELSGGSTTTTSHSVNLLPVFMPSHGMSSRDIGREAVRYLASTGLPINDAGITQKFEDLFAQWSLTYGGRSRG